MELKHFRPPFLVLGLVILVITVSIMVKQTVRREVPSSEQAIQTTQTAGFKLTSPAFDPNGTIPSNYTCAGANINPPLVIENAPGNVKEFVLMMESPDAPNGRQLHWLMWNIPVDTTAIAEHVTPDGATQGKTDFGSSGYSGPCPTSGGNPSHYVFELYALNDSLSLDSTSSRESVIAAMNGKIIAKTQLVGIITAKH